MAHFKDHFSTLAAQYAEFRPRYPAALFEYLASVCQSRQRVWDCACGSGQATVALAEHFEQVIGTDASAKQIAATAPHPRIEYSVAPAEQSGLPSKSFNLVSVAQSLHWFDIERFYAEVRRVLMPQGVLAVWSYGVQRMQHPEIDREFQKFYSETVGPYWPPERTLVEGGYRDIPFPFIELDCPHFMLEEHWPLQHLLGYLRSWSATGRYVKENGLDPVVGLGERLAALWGDVDSPQKVSWPLALRVGRQP